MKFRYSSLIVLLCFAFTSMVTASAADVSRNLQKSLIEWNTNNEWSTDSGRSVGKSMYGFTCYKWNGGTPRMNGWCKTLDKGTANYWDRRECDKNGNGKADGDETVKLKYLFWYQAKVSVIFAWERTPEWFKSETERIRSYEQAGIGDTSSANATNCCVIKGPVYIAASITVVAEIGDYLYFSGDSSQWAIQYSPILEKDALTKKKDGYIKEAGQVLRQLVSDIVVGSPVGKSAAPKKPEAKPALKAAPASKQGSPGLTLTASPAALWADGVSKSTIKLVACDAKGQPIKGEFDIDVANGKCSHVKLITDTNGFAKAEYTAPTTPGEDTITVSGTGSKKALFNIRLGGLRIIQEDATQPSLFADGKTKLGMVVICGDPNFNPLPGTKIKLSVDEKELPAKGKLSEDIITIGSEGKAKFSYKSADVYSKKSNFRMGDVHVTAVATLGKPARTIKANYRIPVYAGEVYLLNVSKVGFKSVEKFKVPAPSRNGVLTGAAIFQSAGGTSYPVAYADVTINDTAGKLVGKARSDEHGKFNLEFVGDAMSSTGQSMELNEPVKLGLDEDMSRLMSVWNDDLAILQKNGYDLSSIKQFAKELPKNMAASITGCRDPLGDSAYLMYTSIKLVTLCRYIKLLDARQDESADWFMDSLKNVTGIMLDFAKVSDKLQNTAKSKLKSKFQPKAWKDFQDKTLVTFINILYAQFQRATDTANNAGYNVESLQPFKGYGADYLIKSGIDELGANIKKGFKAGIHKSSQEIFTRVGGKALLGEYEIGDPSVAVNTAQDILTSYEQAHNKLNMENLDRELYRLDAKLIVDTVVRGPFVYLRFKNFAFNTEIAKQIAQMDVDTLEKVQDHFNESSGEVGAVFNAVDAVFQSYQGYNWIVDFCQAGDTKRKVVKALFP